VPTIGKDQELFKALAAKAARPLSFLSGNYPDQELWRGYARKKIFELLHYAPPRVDFEEEVVGERDCGPYVKRKLWFRSSPYTRVCAVLLLPPQTRGKLPGVICLHDHGGLFAWGKEKLLAPDGEEHPALAAHKEKHYGGMSVAHEMAAAGFAVLAVDSFYFGDRRLAGLPEVDGLDLSAAAGHAEFERVAAEREPSAALNMIQAGATLMGLAIWDAIRSVEFLTTVEGVDGRRIGCFGAHSGGLLAVHLSGLCDLIRVTCAAGWVTTFAGLIEAGVPGGDWAHFAVPGLYNFLDLPDIACLTVPRSLSLMALGDDPAFPGAGAGGAFKNVRKVFQMAGCDGEFSSEVYTGESSFTREMLADCFRWFERWL